LYLKFYNLREWPFSLTCDERFFYESPVHAEALANMIYTVQQGKGMVLITGEVGTGKTFVGNMLGARLGPGCLSAIMCNPPQSAKQFLRALAGRVGLNVASGADKLSLAEEVEQHLIRQHNRDRLVALILDEAQDLPKSSLEEIRLLWNLEENGRRLIQIVLIGQPELRQKIQEPKWESLRQRIVLSYHLGPLTRKDTGEYISHRLKTAADESGAGPEFTEEAVAQIYAASDGIPRLINILCDNALLIGYAKGTRRVDKGIITEVLRDMTCWGLRTSHPHSQTDQTLVTS